MRPRTVLATARAAYAASPVTVTAASAMVLVGAGSGALWSATAAGRLTDAAGYGLPAFTDGNWWTLLTGTGLAVSPIGYLPVLLGLVVIGGLAERRLGAARTVGALTLCQVVGVLASAAFVAYASPRGWDRFTGLVDVTDAGPSAGFLGAAAVATARCARPWRGRLRWVLVGYVSIAVAVVGGIADLEHAFAVAVGLALGPLVAGRPPWLEARRANAPTGDWGWRAVVAHLCTHGAPSRLAWMATWRGTDWFRAPEVPGFVAHRTVAGVALALGDPVAGAPAERARLLHSYAAHCRRIGRVPCVFAASAETTEAARTLGWRALHVADEAVIDLPGLEFRGRAWQDVRTALNQAARLGIELRLGRLADEPAAIRAQVEQISAVWVADKPLPELGFTLGGMDEALDRHVRVALAVGPGGAVHGFTSWLPVHRPGDGRVTGWTLDVMRRRPDAFRGVMEFLIASACLAFREEGADTVSLSAAPLVRASAVGSPVRAERSDGWLDSRLDACLEVALDRLGDVLEPCYGFRSLHAFKAKFQPRYEPLYLLHPSALALPRIGLALLLAYLPSATVADLRTLARRRRVASGTPNWSGR